MATLIDLRRRIRSVKNTQQITKAMKMVSAAKLRRAQERMLAARPYAAKMTQVLSSLATRANPETHPLLQVKGDQNVELMVITADKGLCGSFNANLIKAALHFLDERKNYNLSLHLVGRKAVDYFRKRKYTIRQRYVNIFQNVKYEHARQISQETIAAYLEGNLDAIYIIYNEFKSMLQQRIVLKRLLPLEKLPEDTSEPALDYIYEPDPVTIFDRLLPKYLEIQVLQALLESSASEHAARMTAMDSATKNAKEMIETLTLKMNKIRQAGITREIIEVVSGAEGLS
ncbi:MAG: ATP synthase F1 subunit gamma [Acidobacteria bacterium]|nr:MAG: ATP synthase F1 subunit gamma [Acidobacteriota bacterium]